jgi:hypothetical protein
MDDDVLGSAMATDELGGTFSGGGVTLRGGGAKYDLPRISQKDNMSIPSSITPFNLIPYLNNYEHFIQCKKCRCCLPGCNVLGFDLGALLPMHGNNAILGGETIERGSVALTVAPNDEYFLAYILFERIEAGVAYFYHK